jgi:hypothetical protein
VLARRIQRGLQGLVDGARSRDAAVHRAQHLDVAHGINAKLPRQSLLDEIDHGLRDCLRIRAQTQANLEALDTYCEVIPAYGPEARPELLERLEPVLSSEEHAVLGGALERGLCLVSTDMRLRHFAAEINLRGIWPQVLLQYAAGKSAVSPAQYSNAAVLLLLGNHSFVTLMPTDLITLCRQNTHWVRYGIARLKGTCRTPTLGSSAPTRWSTPS